MTAVVPSSDVSKLGSRAKQAIAIVLVGPAGAGKTDTRKALLKRYPDAVFRDLDAGWGETQKRYQQGPNQYSDLEVKNQNLVVELAGGEPGDRTFEGATRNPSVWGSVLRKEGRKIFLFRFQIPPELAKKRQIKRAEEDPSRPFDQWGWRGTFDSQERDREGFAKRLEEEEVVIRVTETGPAVDQVVSTIVQVIAEIEGLK